MSIVQAQEGHVQTVCEWLLAEHLDTGGGLYDNAHMLPEAQSAGKLYCFVSLDEVLGFVMLHTMSESASISLLEVSPGHRRKGIGRQLATFAMERLFAAGAEFIKVECSPHESEAFWRGMGFQSDGAPPKSRLSNPKLCIRAPVQPKKNHS
jgi:ribosomal protein S18 acetylase RimI-like enzyme